MALFTQFFPTAGDGVGNNPGTLVGRTDLGFVITNHVAGTNTLTLQHIGGTYSVAQGDRVTFTRELNGIDINLVGTIAGPAGAGAEISVLILVDFAESLNGNATNVSFRNGFDASFGGDVNVAGDLNAGNIKTGIAEATEFQGPLTGNASTATALETGREFSVAGDATTAAGVSFDGTGNVELSISLSADSVGANELANDVIGVNSGLSITDGVLDLNPNIDGAGLTLANGVLSVDAVRFNDTFSFASIRTDNTNVRADLIAAFNDAGTATQGITVPADTQFQTGDIILINFTGGVETFLYVQGTTKTAQAGGAGSILESGDVVDVTNEGTGGTVQSVSPGAGLTTNTGDTIDPIINIGANADGTITVNAGDIQVGTLIAGNYADNTITNTKLVGDVTTLVLPIQDDATDSFVDSAISQSAFLLTGNVQTTINSGLDITGAGTETVGITTDTGNISLTTAGMIGQTDIDLTVTGAGGVIGIDAINIEIGNAGSTTTLGSTGNTGGTVSHGTLSLPGLPDLADDRFLQVTAAGVVSAAAIPSGSYAFTLGTDANITIATANLKSRLISLPVIGAPRTLTLEPGVEGDSVKVSNLSAVGGGSGVNRWTINTTTQGIMGTTDLTLPLDDATASFELYNTGSTWLIIGAN